ncbi:histone deacetylase family protein [Mesorhizobium sp. B4-1-4]|uniref:histone deacetylase family protein n=1 Tax=Mesorhizobium sp. B4-1-4 TaxID=2589888 RepID=UPI00112D44FC|nr:histone deacetylase family protein [Mesorhizobium sp. B4-1-4]UCI32074.1 histone deacetylase family protein [Mesorhizobium sp. B4-1-4]
MKTVFSDRHKMQSVETEFYRGKWVKAFEIPRRAQLILDAVQRADLGPIVEPESFDLAPAFAVHDADFVRFLENFWAEWVSESGAIPAYPNIWPPRRTRMIPTVRPGAELGRYAVDMSSPVLEGTWQATRAAVDCALTGARFVNAGDPSAFALCRPPGHHSGRDYFGGYCFLNNAAIAAQYFRDAGAHRVAVLDIDYHHGNGTQDIFYDRDDILTVSIHGDPVQEYPYYIGFADETGQGTGQGFNLNLPLPWGTDFSTWCAALNRAIDRIAAAAPDRLVVSLGVDTFEEDPMSHFKLASPDFVEIGRRIGALKIPALFVMEGGYAIETIGTNVVNVLRGHLSAQV